MWQQQSVEPSKVRVRLGEVPRESVRRRRWLTIGVMAAVAASFGPYVLPGVRLEQLFYFGGAAVVVGVSLTKWPALDSKGRPLVKFGVIGLFLVSWSIYFFGSLVSMAFHGGGVGSYVAGDALAGINRLLLPLSAAIVALGFARLAKGQDLFKVACLALVLFTCANSVVAVVQVANPDLTWLYAWNAIEEGRASVFSNAAELGRYSGIFNQPAEAGLAYSMAGICAAYYYRSRPIRSVPIMSLIALGGLLSVSKIFLFVGVPLMILVALVVSTRRTFLLYWLSVAIVGIYFCIPFLSSTWSGFGYATRFWGGAEPSGDGFLSTLTGGRLGGASGTLERVSSSVLEQFPLLGVGAQGLQTAYDSAWVEALIVAGLVGVFALTVAQTALTIGAVRLTGSKRVVAVSLCVVMWAVSIGLPALNANRSGSALVLLLVLAMATVSIPNGVRKSGRGYVLNE